MNESNHKIYAFVMAFEHSLNIGKLKSDFTKESRLKNKKELKTQKKDVSLEYLKDESESDILFFTIHGWDKDNISVTKLEEDVDVKSYLPENEKVKTHGFFAIYKNILFTLFNQKAFGKVTPTLCDYINERYGEHLLSCKHIQRDLTTEEVDKLFKGEINHIHFEVARTDYKTYEKQGKTRSDKKLKGYTLKKEVILKLQRLHNAPDKSEIKKIFDKFRKKEDYTKIVIGAKDHKDLNILADQYFLKFKCNVKTDDDGLSIFEDFKKRILEIVGELPESITDHILKS